MSEAILQERPVNTEPEPMRSEDIRAVLQQEIEQGKLPPGTPLEERGLAARFGVSRTKVREALQQLAARELVRIEPYVGARVARLTVSELREVIEYCCELEVMTARLAARRIDLDLRREMEQALAWCRQEAREGARYGDANRAFHDVLERAARNAFLVRQLTGARAMLFRYTPSLLETQKQIDRSQRDHEALAAAIYAGDEGLAGELMSAHVPNGNTGFAEYLARVPAEYFEIDRPFPGSAS